MIVISTVYCVDSDLVNCYRCTWLCIFKLFLAMALHCIISLARLLNIICTERFVQSSFGIFQIDSLCASKFPTVHIDHQLHRDLYSISAIVRCSIVSMHFIFNRSQCQFSVFTFRIDYRHQVASASFPIPFGHGRHLELCAKWDTRVHAIGRGGTESHQGEK